MAEKVERKVCAGRARSPAQELENLVLGDGGPRIGANSHKNEKISDTLGTWVTFLLLMAGFEPGVVPGSSIWEISAYISFIGQFFKMQTSQFSSQSYPLAGSRGLFSATM
jgi:hypothetical protein